MKNKPFILNCQKSIDNCTIWLADEFDEKVKGKVPRHILYCCDQCSRKNCLNDLQWKTLFKMLTGYKRIGPFSVKSVDGKKTFFEYPKE